MNWPTTSRSRAPHRRPMCRSGSPKTEPLLPMLRFVPHRVPQLSSWGSYEVCKTVFEICEFGPRMSPSIRPHFHHSRDEFLRPARAHQACLLHHERIPRARARRQRLSERGLPPYQARSFWRSARRDRGRLARDADLPLAARLPASGSIARLASSPRPNTPALSIVTVWSDLSVTEVGW